MTDDFEIIEEVYVDDGLEEIPLEEIELTPEEQLFLDEMVKRQEEFRDGLPSLITNFSRTAGQFSYLNEIPATIGAFSILGQIAKDFIHIPSRFAREDSRIHFCWIQTSGTGKSEIWNFISPIYEAVSSHINSNANHPKFIYKDEFIPLPYGKFSLTDYTDAVLIGKYRKEEVVDEDTGERDIEYVRIRGSLEGSGIAHWDEFEYSGVFKATQSQHSSRLIVYLNKLMNSKWGNGWIITKALSETDGLEMDCFCQRSVWATTYIPEKLNQVIANTGVLQRMLTYVRDVPLAVQDKMRLEQYDYAGEAHDYDAPIDTFAQQFKDIYDMLYQRYESVDGDKTKVILYHPQFKDAIKYEYRLLMRYLRDRSPKVAKMANNFTSRWMIILQKLSHLCAIAEAPYITDEDRRFIVSPRHVSQGASVIKQCFISLVEWFEKEMGVKNVSNTKAISKITECFKGGFIKRCSQGYFYMETLKDALITTEAVGGKNAANDMIKRALEADKELLKVKTLTNRDGQGLARRKAIELGSKYQTQLKYEGAKF
jgi:hypothetical protein